MSQNTIEQNTAHQNQAESSSQISAKQVDNSTEQNKIQQNLDRILGSSNTQTQPQESDLKQEQNQQQPSSQPSQQSSQQQIIPKQNLSKQEQLQQQYLEEKARLDKYQKIKIIGQGSYGTVTLVRNARGEYLAMKEVSQKKLKKDQKSHQAYMEKLLCHFSHPGIPEFHSCFSIKMTEQLYFIMQYAEGEQLSQLIRKHYDLLTENIIRFYVAEMVLILEYIHSLGFSHRDFKAENLVLTKVGHIQLIDYGTLNDYCKQLMPKEALKNVEFKDKYRRDRITAEKKLEIAKKTEEQMIDRSLQADKKAKDVILTPEDQDDIEKRVRCQTFCGTLEYLCPEMIEESSCEMSGDLWALGCLVYKMFTNFTPFVDENQMIIYQKIKQGNYNKHHEKIPSEAQNLIDCLLTSDPHQRIGSVRVDENTTANDVHESYDKLRKHEFFFGIDWEGLYKSDPPKEIIDLLTQIRNPALTAEDQDQYCNDEDEDDDFNLQQMQNTPQSQKSQNITPISESIKDTMTKSSESNIAQKKQSNNQQERKIGSETFERNMEYVEVVKKFVEPFTMQNLFFQTRIIKVNKHLLLFSTKKPRQILLFDVEPITIIYYMPFKPNPTYKKIVFDKNTNVLLESQTKIIISDSNDKYIFEDRSSNEPAQLHDAINRLKKKRNLIK